MLALALNTYRKGPRDSCRAGRVAGLLLALASALTVGGPKLARAQQFAVFAPAPLAFDANQNQEKPVAAFSLPTQTTDLKDSLEEFQRLVQHEAWEKAFKTLETIASKSSTGFVDRSDGVLVPSRLLMRTMLAKLPLAGKSAYRVFYDSQATALWDKAEGRGELENLSTIVNNHLISSVGDRAADRLGDLYFERGELEQAAMAWRSILAYCPDSKLSKPEILIKIATALARSGRWNEFHDVEREVRERYAAETVEAGGGRLPAADYMTRLATAAQAVESPTAAALPDDFDLPAADDPVWQFRFQTKHDPRNPNQQPFEVMDVYGRQRTNDFTIPAAVDAQRVYVNLFGVEMAFDLESGKIVWRSGRLHQLQLGQGRQGVVPERYVMMVSGDRTWSVTRDPQTVNQHPPSFNLIVRESATGKEVFSSRRTLSSWNIMGVPYLAGNMVYVGANRTNQGRELAVLVLDAKDGKLLKTVVLGNHAVDQNQVYGERVSEPSFLFHRDRLFVDTHAGALISVQPQAGSIDWGILYDSPPAQTGYYYYEYQPPQFSVGAPAFAGGLLFSKGMRSSRLVAVQPDGPALAWNRPVAKSAVVIGVDDDCIYLGGEELCAYSLKTQELMWASQLPRTAAWSVPVMTKTRIYQFTSRGICEVDKQTGRLLKIFRGIDLDSFGGSIFLTPKALVTVSNMAITAYPLNFAPPETPAN